MQHLRTLSSLSLESTWLTIGVFDGFHRGHREIIEPLVQGAKAAHATSLVVSFYPHPAVVLGKRNDLSYLTLPEEKADYLAQTGVDVLLTLPFDRDIAAQSPETFMQSLQERIKIEKLLIGYDFALGKNRRGDAAYLSRLGEKDGYEVQRCEPLLDDEGIISSSRVRDALADGRVRDAQQLLGHPYTLRGAVVHGDGRGRKINIPTANIAVPAEKAIPANGVYACWVYIDKEAPRSGDFSRSEGLTPSLQGKTKHPAVTNVGIRPTFTPDQVEANVEAHLLDFDADVYDKELKLAFVEHLREEKKFNGVDELIAQIHADIERARTVLG